MILIVPVNINRYTYSFIKDDFAISYGIFQMKYKTQTQWQLEFKIKRCGTLN